MSPLAPRGVGPYVDITPDELPSHLPGARIVDVREPSEFAGPLGRIPGAELAPLTQLGARAAAWPTEQPVILVCRSGARSARAAAELARSGFRHAFNPAAAMGRICVLSSPIARGAA